MRMASGSLGSTNGGVCRARFARDARDGAVVVAGGKDRLAHDQVVGQFHPDDDIEAGR